MVNEAAKEMGRKGGKVTSEAKTLAARANARKPRTKKPIPELSTYALLRLAVMELRAERDRCAAIGERYDSLKLNGHDLIEVIDRHIKMTAAS